MSKPFDLTRFLPTRYRNKTLDSLLRNLFNRHLSKEDTVPLFGYVGDTSSLQPGEVSIVEQDLERQLNQLTPLIYTEHATEKLITSWPDLVQKLVLLGVDYTKIGQIFTSKSFNFVPPIDLDKFCNFNEYFWVGNWMLAQPNLPWSELGIPTAAAVDAVFVQANNPAYTPEYYVIGRGALAGGNPVSIAPNFPNGWSDWSVSNLWCHREDVITFINAHPGVINFDELVQAIRPIIEYDKNISLNTYQNAQGEPASTGTYVVPHKLAANKPPLFDLFSYRGDHLGVTSSIFYYSESTEFPVDSALNRRVATDANGNYVFEHSLVNDDASINFYKLYVNSSESLATIWKGGPDVAPNYVKYDVSGTLINQDKFSNFKNYFWTAVDGTSNPSYNPLGLPEYNVIEIGGTSDWSVYNAWVHVNQLKKSKLKQYVQATRPIIEFNKALEDTLLLSKTKFQQLPTFAIYRFQQSDDSYQSIPSGSTPEELNLNDAYAQHSVLARLSDLGQVEDSVRNSPEILANCFEFAGETYIQSLSTGKFLPTNDGIVYGYNASTTASPVDTTKGSCVVTGCDSNCTPQVLTITWTGTDFLLTGSVTGASGTISAGSSVTVSGTGIQLTVGTTDLEVGDYFTVETKSAIYASDNLFVLAEGAFRTIYSPDGFLSEQQNKNIVSADTSVLDGTWEVPPQLLWNVANETRATVIQGDLYYHFTSIIAAQPGLLGSESGSNNWRALTAYDLGAGGKIKQYDGDLGLLVSMLMQDGISHLALLDFARESYEKLGQSVHTYVEQYLPELITQNDFDLPEDSDSSIDPALLLSFKNYFSSLSSVTSASASTIDDFLASPFYDSTSGLAFLVPTLPALGLANLTQPAKKFDAVLGYNVLVHHDGHERPLPTTSVAALKKIVTREYVRSPGQSTPGEVTGSTFPVRPYKKQFYFRTTTTKLYCYDVVSDTGEMPSDAENGAYSLDRANGILYQHNSTWNQVGTTEAELQAPWVEVNLGLIEQNILLALEQEIYDNIPVLTGQVSAQVTLQSNASYSGYMQSEFERFGIIYGAPDVYSSAYDPTNSLTWNYSSASIPTFQGIYQYLYGTPRPDLQPWIPAGYASESLLLADLITAALIPAGTTSWSITFWPACASFLRAKYVTNGVTNLLSVDTTNGALLGPYGFGNAEQVINAVPDSASSNFAFGDNGPIEAYWKTTLNYLYSQQKVYFKINPREYVSKTWGVLKEAGGEYELNPLLLYRDNPSTTKFHGDPLVELINDDWITVVSVSPPLWDQVYTVRCVSRLENKFEVTTSADATPQIFTGLAYNDGVISITLTPSLRQFFYGDAFSINANADGTLSTTAVPAQYMRLEGFNQLYVQYNRVYGQDVQVSLNKSLFTNWDVKLSYRFGGLVNTDLVSFKNVDVIDQSAFNIYLKENKFYASSWINSLRVQLAVRGSSERVNRYNVPSIGPGGTPGEDWVFRIDTFNSQRPQLTWNLADTTATPQTFTALDGSATYFQWKKFPITAQTVTINAPFLITGIQNLINFILGYSTYLFNQGWRFNEQNTHTDPSTFRTIDYQLLVEQFIVQQFSGVVAGSAFVFNPFIRKSNYATARGTVSNLNDKLGIEQETICRVLDASGKQIPTNKMRLFRQDDITSIVSDVPVYTMHLLTSEYEHVVLFEDYSVDNTLIFDPFLGQKTETMFIYGQKSSEFTGRLDFGGHFLLNDQMKRNLEASVSGIIKLYDTTQAQENLPETERARSLLGYQKKDYFAERGTPDPTQFRFWQGMIANKGTNFSIDAYTNSAKYSSAKLDEYWAYKIAEYGDARPSNKPELKIEPDDTGTDLTNYLFVEDDDLATVRAQLGAGYDDPAYSYAPYDGQIVFNPDTFYEVLFDPAGTILIRPNDEQRWFRYIDLHQLQYFETYPLIQFNLTPTNLEDYYLITDAKGNPVRCDVFELLDTTLTNASLGGYDDAPYDDLPYDYSSNDATIYRETGDLVIGTSPPVYSDPKFRRVNQSTVQILDNSILNHALVVIGYAPNFRSYSPEQIYNYVDNVTAKDDVIWWDPARGSHHPLAIAQVDYTTVTDPARYNVTFNAYKNTNLNKQKPWGANEVGKIWWNKNNLAYKPYSDTKIVRDMNDRLAQWGSISDLSTIEVYEWVQSSTPPTSYTDDGIVALNKQVSRTRTWYQRPIAWKFASNPKQETPAFAAYQPAALKLDYANGSGSATLKSGSFSDLGLVKGYKIAGVAYSDNSMQDAYITDLFGTALITSTEYSVFGTYAGYDDNPLFVPDSNFTFDLEIVPNTFAYRSGKNLGQYILDNETDVAGITYIKLTCVSSGVFQTLELDDTPVKANSKQTFYFDQLGIKANVVVAYSHATQTTQATRVSLLATALGNTGHDIFIRASVDISVPISFNYLDTAFDELLDVPPDIEDPQPPTVGWVSWQDPITNPYKGTQPPYNKYVPLAGDYTEIGNALSDLVADITLRTNDPWLWFDGNSYNPYMFTWSNWSEVLPEIRTARVVAKSGITLDSIYQANFTFTNDTFFVGFKDSLLSRMQVYLNENLLPASAWTLMTNTAGDYYVTLASINQADTVKVKLAPIKPTPTALAFDPAVKDDPIILTQFNRELPYVEEIRRDANSNRTIKNYYFWVKNKIQPAVGKALSVTDVAAKLRQHDDIYSVPQVIKFYNQLDGRPNRYSLLSLKGLTYLIRRQSAYKLRLGKTPSLREDDLNTSLKNVHVEWKLLRAFQPNLIPQQLWTLVIDSLCGANQLDQSLPSSALELYDSRNNTEQRYGFGDSQIFVDPEIARGTLKYTILNTRVDKYVNGVLVPDYISYQGFDINLLDTYLATPTTIRKFMSDLWRFAEPKQVNEIFFAVLEDAVAKNLELTDFFKTSFISLSEIRTLGET